MAIEEIILNKRILSLHSAVSDPEFSSPNIICNDPWDYVKLWLRREHHDKALFFWDQAKHFYHASMSLPETASPLTSYYCFLNATKALLEVKGTPYSTQHGVTGKTHFGYTSLANEIVCLKTNGVLPSLCNLLQEPVIANESFSLKDAIYHLPFVHRAYTLTNSASSELFIPLKNPRFVRKTNSTEAWFMAEIDACDFNAATAKMLPNGYEIDPGVTDTIVVRRKKRFEWNFREREKSLQRLKKYHKHTRKDVIPIFAPTNSWYLKKEGKLRTDIKKTDLPLMFASMHKLSELARYEPFALTKHLDARHNWLLTEFLRLAPAQYINRIACEITGREFIVTSAFSLQSKSL